MLTVGKPFYCVTLFNLSKRDRKMRVVWGRSE